MGNNRRSLSNRADGKWPGMTGAVVAALWLVTALLGSPTTRAQEPLEVIDGRDGGKVIYGAMEGTSPATAMSAVLHYVRRAFGTAPVVGKVFESRDRQNFGAFFTVTASAPGSKPFAGVAIVSLAQGTNAAAAVLYDESARFAQTEPQLLRALTDAWRTAATSSGPARSHSASVPLLTATRFPDGSGAVNLPEGWRITFASHGAALIVGPHDEQVLLSNSVGPIYDPNNPQVQARLRFANPRNPPILCPTSDALHTYLCVLQRNKQQPTFQLKQSRPIPALRLAVESVLIEADLDLHDGKGLRSCELGLSVTAVEPQGGRTLGINGTCAPQSLAALEQPTLKAIYDSYGINRQVVAQEFKGDEQRSRQAGNNARIQANAAHAAEDARSASFQAHMDNIDRMSKSFQNIQLDQTELQDSQEHSRGAVPNALADALIKANPGRYQTVPSQDFLKGTDF
jgi:hypothetical protein